MGLTRAAPNPSGLPAAAQLMYVKVPGLTQPLLIDTGAQVSVLTPSVLPHHACISTEELPRLEAANGSAVQTLGRFPHVIQLGNTAFQWDFVVANVATPFWARISSHIMACRLTCADGSSETSLARSALMELWLPFNHSDF